MDHFERQLAQLMRDAEEPALFDPRQQERLRAEIGARRHTRAVRRAVGSVLAVVCIAGIGIGLMLLPGSPTRVEPGGIRPRPATSPTPPAPTGTPDVSPGTPPPSSAPPDAPAPPDGTATTMTSDRATETADGRTATTSPPSTFTSAPSSTTATATATARNDASTQTSSLITP
ncbi:hypothetical protein [Streptomyces sp. NPDC005476]|uniref:hypothetical protein n=1 Tax=Streptomyces sp. NPDC005476 TaxID=3156882 RepID=UPI0034567A55